MRAGPLSLYIFFFFCCSSFVVVPHSFCTTLSLSLSIPPLLSLSLLLFFEVKVVMFASPNTAWDHHTKRVEEPQQEQVALKERLKRRTKSNIERLFSFVSSGFDSWGWRRPPEPSPLWRFHRLLDTRQAGHTH